MDDLSQEHKLEPWAIAYEVIIELLHTSADIRSNLAWSATFFIQMSGESRITFTCSAPNYLNEAIR